LLEIEYIKQDQALLDAQKLTYETKLQSFRADLAKLGFDYSDELFADDQIVAKTRCDKLMLDIINKCTTIRSYEDYGTGFFWHREIYENGDGYWSLLFGLAGGRKQGDTEQTQVLQFLYRFTRDGQRSEKLIFPFISVQKDGDNVRSSFLWRLWEQHKQNGKSGGHFFFIPYGD
ncbi:MAG: hypothetical protein J6X55_03155, partial [Victivallales bacterium]|nr:hypothetical protein [Victivallales bacterium]